MLCVIYQDKGPSIHGMYQKLFVVRVRDMGREDRAGAKDVKDGDDDDHMATTIIPVR